MKRSKMPTKPYAPAKPQEPQKQIEQLREIGKVSIASCSVYSIKQLLVEIKTKTEGEYPLDDLRFEFFAYHGYDDNIDIEVSILINELVDNPNYDNMVSWYKTNLERYEKAKAQYPIDLKKYKKDKKEYDLTMDKYYLEKSKSRVAQLEKKLGTK